MNTQNNRTYAVTLSNVVEFETGYLDPTYIAVVSAIATHDDGSMSPIQLGKVSFEPNDNDDFAMSEGHQEDVEKGISKELADAINAEAKSVIWAVYEAEHDISWYEFWWPGGETRQIKNKKIIGEKMTLLNEKICA